MHKVEEEGNRAQQNQGGKKRKPSSRETHPCKKGGKFYCKGVHKSPSKSGSAVIQVWSEILVKGRSQKE
jgi:hypothetical protein